MIYTPNTKRALKCCFEAHKDQLDKSGLPYIFHPFHVAEQMKDEETVIVALLHDVVEDTHVTLEDLRGDGYSEEVLAALDLLTHRDGVPYMDYVSRAAQNPIARAVKIADLTHNMDTSRLDEVDDEAVKRLEKYRSALKLLESFRDSAE